MTKFIMNVGDLKKQLKDVPDTANVALCVEEFPYAVLYGAVSFDPPSVPGEVGTLLLSVHPETEVASFLKSAVV